MINIFHSLVNLRLRRIAAALVLGVVAANADAAEDKRAALVIGNSAYQLTAPLTNPRNDADDMAAALKRLGFDVVEGRDLDKRGMEQALARFSRLASTSDAALVYYAGHGLQHQGQNFLVPIDAKLDDEFSISFELLKIDEVLTALDRAKGVRILVLDACRNSLFADKLSRMTARNRDIVPARGLARIERSEGMVIAYATQPNQVATDGNGRNSPFTAALIKEIAEPGQELATVFRKVAASVHQTTGGRQTPELSLSILGDFYFNRAETDQQAWGRLRNSGDVKQLQDFIATFPKSFLADAARARIDAIERAERDARERERTARTQSAREEQLSERLARLEAEKQQAAEELAARDKAEKERVAREQTERNRLRAQREETSRAQATTAASDRERVAVLEAEQRKLTEQLAARDKAEEERVALEKSELARRALLQRQRDEEVVRLDREKREIQERLAKLEESKREAAANAQDVARKLSEGGPQQQAALTPPEPGGKASTLSGGKLVAAIQNELTRVGCYAGKPDEKWTGAATTRSVGEFAKHASLQAPDLPSNEFLDAIKGRQGRVCPLVCALREVNRGGVCVAKTCPAGETLSRNGECVAPAKKVRRAQEETPRVARPKTEAPARASGGGRCFTFQGKQFCE